jgi:hypothetical protein
MVRRPQDGRVGAPSRAGVVALALAFGGALPGAADIAGFVRVVGSGTPGTPIANARVHLRAQPGVLVLSGADGSFSLPVNPGGAVEVTAALAYDRAAPTNYLIGGAIASNGDTNVDIRLAVLPTATNATYVPPAAGDNCANCHGAVGGIFEQWLGSNHADAASNPWVRDLYSGDGTPGGAAGYVFLDTHDAGETGFCATCHAPMEDVFQPGQTFYNQLDTTAGADGVTCTSCHQMDSVNSANLNALHFVGGKSTYRFPEGDAPTSAYVWAPLDDASTPLMRASYSTLHKDSLLCASCHQYNNPDNGAPGQHTYSEWASSPFAVPGPNFKTCQDCHMPPSVGDGAVCIFTAEDRPGEQRRQHTFIGSTPATLQANLSLTLVAQEVGPGRIRATADVTNFGAGHSFPTGVSIRNALLVLEATYSGGPLPQVAGPTIPAWGSDDVPGQQAGDFGGAPGKGFAKVLSGRINGAGPVVEPVLFIDAETATSTTIASGAVDSTVVEFQLPPGTPAGTSVTVNARLLYRRAFRALQVTKGWTESAHGGPIEIEVATQEAEVVSGGAPGITEIPALSRGGAVLLALVLASVGFAVLRRR